MMRFHTGRRAVTPFGIRFGLRGFALFAVLGLVLISPPVYTAEPELPPELEAVRDAVKKYRDPIVAVRDGYFSTAGCVRYPDGNMGVHFLNAQLIGPEPDPMKPQILLYEPVDGGLELVGVEWFVPLSTGVEKRPELFDQPFEGPMEGHEPLIPAELHHYDLHAWVFKQNPAGLFHHSNPDVSCDGKWGYAVDEHPPDLVSHDD